MHDWLRWLFADVEGEVEFRALPNVRGEGKPELLFTRDPAVLARFVARNDVPGRAVYYGVATRQPGTAPPGRLGTLQSVPALWVDLDHVQDKEAVIALLRGCYCAPSAIIDSGGGLHAYWKLIEPEDVSDATSNDHPLVEALRGLRRVFNGDSAVCDLARIMRLPGTKNTKYGEPREVRVVHLSDTSYALHDVTDWLASQCELIGEPRNPWLAACEALGVKPALDVEEALATMAPGNIHERQLRVSASLLTAGKHEDEITARLLEATRLAAGEEGRRWDWRREEAGIREMIRGAGKKFQVVNLQQRRQERVVNGGGDVAAPVPGKSTRGVVFERVARLALEVWGRPLITVEGEFWTYEAGAWRLLDAGGLHDLRTHVHGAARTLKVVEEKVLTGAWKWIHQDPALVRRDVRWDCANVVVGLNGALEIETGRLVPHSPEHYATRKIACRIDPEAKCPRWLEFLNGALPEDTAAVIQTLQEWFGAALIKGKTRETKKGLIIYGPSYTGKTQVAKVARALISGKVCGLMVKAMSGTFGVQPLVKASAWIADDAVGPNEELDSEVYKHAITGELMTVDLKHKDQVDVEFELPVLLTMNNFPKVKDSSDAVYNRTLVLAMRVVRAVKDASRGREIADIIITEELAGILNWAAEGWRSLQQRGWFDPPAIMLAAAAEFRTENNPWKDFAELCLEEDSDRMIMRNDLTTVFNAWVKQEQGGREWSGKLIAKFLKGSMPNVVGTKVHEGAVWVGLRFKEPARAFLPLEMGAKEPPALQQLNKGLTAAVREFIGRPIVTKF
jgi:P4 family phage/plasmid primase-like protien